LNEECFRGYLFLHGVLVAKGVKAKKMLHLQAKRLNYLPAEMLFHSSASFAKMHYQNFENLRNYERSMDLSKQF